MYVITSTQTSTEAVNNIILQPTILIAQL